MTKVTVLFVSHQDRHCGVFQFGKNIASALRSSQRFDFRYVECGGREDLRKAITATQPGVVIYNHHPSTAPWLTIFETRRYRVPQLGIVHEVNQEYADAAGKTLFDYYIAPDPTLLLRNPNVFKTGRLVMHWETRFPPPPIPTIGSFGFATGGKNFEHLVETVQAEFDEARVRLNIPCARHADPDGTRAREIASRCRALIKKPGISLDVTHEFLDDPALLDFLASNSLNAFLYDDMPGRGVSSTLDYALSVDRPIAISKSRMFRHVRGARPSIVLGDRSLRQILEQGTSPLERFKSDWSPENLLWDYERIVSAVLDREARYARPLQGNRAGRTIMSLGFATLDRGLRITKRLAGPTARALLPTRTLSRLQWLEGGVLRRIGYFGTNARAVGDWIPTSTTDDLDIHSESIDPYIPEDPAPHRFNRILDDAARAQYGPALHYLSVAAPKVFARKIARANVQQAFVLDTVARFAGPVRSARLLSIGSYEDTAAISLSRSGYDIEEIDPLLNYDLNTFIGKPSVKPASFDVILSTSVLEHIQDDEEFVSHVAYLLKPGGVAVFTCDFREGYKPGDPMPATDRRLYTVEDLSCRLLRKMPECSLVDEPTWASAVPDFECDGACYSFAGFVVRRHRGASKSDADLRPHAHPLVDVSP